MNDPRLIQNCAHDCMPAEGTDESLRRTNVILIGMPGAGKSTLGVVLAKILQYDFLDADLLIQRKHGGSLKDIINRDGVDAFVKKEGDVLKSINTEHTVIATGGSAVYSDDAMEYLATLGPVVYLRTSEEDLHHRLGSLAERGVVLRAGVSMSLEDLIQERLPLYEHYGEVVVDTVDGNITESAYALADKLRPYLDPLGDGISFDEFPL